MVAQRSELRVHFLHTTFSSTHILKVRTAENRSSLESRISQLLQTRWMDLIRRNKDTLTLGDPCPAIFFLLLGKSWMVRLKAGPHQCFWYDCKIRVRSLDTSCMLVQHSIQLFPERMLHRPVPTIRIDLSSISRRLARNKLLTYCIESKCCRYQCWS